MIDNSNFNNQNFDEDNDIDIKHLINILKRNKYLILNFSIIFFVVACLFGIFKKKVWIGEFDIVIKNRNQKQSSLISRFTQNSNIPLDFVFDNTNDIKTEVGILESSSILLPIFNYVNNQRKIVKPNIKDLNFSIWKKNKLKIKLKRNTSILNISYKDSDKKLINNVLKKIANEYQIYSGRNKKRTFELSREYLNQQIKIYQINYNDSMNKTQKFAIDNDIAFPLVISDNNLSKNMIQNKNDIDIEVVRVNATNRIRKNLELIKKIEDTKSFSNNEKFVGSSLINLENSFLPQRLEDIEEKISLAEVKYTSKDLTLNRLKEQRDILIKLIKEKSISILKSKIIEDKALVKASTRPKEILLQYKELMRSAKRDEKTLVSLENQLRILNLQEAKTEDPWELITKPTIKDIPFSPKKKQLALNGLLLGFFLGSLISIFKEIRSGNIYEESILEAKLNSRISKKYLMDKKQFYEIQNEILLAELKKDLGFISLLFTSNISNDLQTNFINYLKENMDNKTIKINNLENNLSDNNNPRNIFLVTKLKNLKKDEIDNLKSRIELSAVKLEGIFLIV